MPEARAHAAWKSTRILGSRASKFSAAACRRSKQIAAGLKHGAFFPRSLATPPDHADDRVAHAHRGSPSAGLRNGTIEAVAEFDYCLRQSPYLCQPVLTGRVGDGSVT